MSFKTGSEGIKPPEQQWIEISTFVIRSINQ